MSPVLMADNSDTVDTKIVSPARSSETVPAKRHTSPSLDSNAKRACIKHDESSKPTTPTTENYPSESTAHSNSAKPKEVARKSSIVDDKKRGQRLFGSFLSVINQNAPSKQQKRRLEIEKRQIERTKLQKVQDEVKKAIKLSELNAIRKSEQVIFDEETMRIRHASMLAMANFLCTKTEPKLYYKPWELLPEQEECIKSQISTVSAEIEREVASFNKRHNRDTKEVKKTRSSETVGEPHIEPPSVITNVDETTTNTTDPSTPDIKTEPKENDVKDTKDTKDTEENREVTVKAEEKPSVKGIEEGEKIIKVKDKDREREEHNGEVMVVNEEDTVIY